MRTNVSNKVLSAAGPRSGRTIRDVNILQNQPLLTRGARSFLLLERFHLRREVLIANECEQ